MVLALAGTVLAVAFARGLTTILVAQLATGLGTVFIDLSWNTRVFEFTSGVAVLACLFFGLAPALKATSLAPSDALKSGGRAITASRERFGMRRTLVVTQVALSLVLLIGALLFTRTLYNLLTIDAGFDQRVIVAYLNGRSLAGDVDRGNMVREQIRTQLSSIPGVTSVALSGSRHLAAVSGTSPSTSMVSAETRRSQTSHESAKAISGRWASGWSRAHLDQRDTRTSVPVAIVNQAFVRKVRRRSHRLALLSVCKPRRESRSRPIRSSGCRPIRNTPIFAASLNHSSCSPPRRFQRLATGPVL